MELNITGKALLLGNNIDTDQIYPGRFLDLVDPAEIAAHCLDGIDSATPRTLAGSVVVSGTNFGCGSSREHAVIALQSAGVQALLADSFARIFYRNAINLGLPLLVCPGISKMVKEGHTLEVDVLCAAVTIMETGETIQCEKIGEHAIGILRAGGIKPLFCEKYRQ